MECVLLQYQGGRGVVVQYQGVSVKRVATDAEIGNEKVFNILLHMFEITRTGDEKVSNIHK